MKLDLSKHRLTVLHDHGVYRHLYGSLPDTGIWSFSVVTWPYHLTVSGDLGNATFSVYDRDVLPIFRLQGSQSYEYLAEKAELAGSSRVWTFDAAKVRENLLDYYGDRLDTQISQLVDDLHYGMTADECGEVIESHGLPGIETYEVLDAGRIIDPHFNRLCDAVAWARQQYVAAREGESA